jgi:HEAT repeat protein
MSDISRSVEDRIQQLRQLRSAASNKDTEAALRKALQDRSNLVAAESAKTIAVLRLPALIPALLVALDRFFNQAVKSDPKCWAKAAIVKTLTELDYDESPPFVRGLNHIQMEPVWGGQEDSAIQLRGLCALGLVQCTDLRRLQIMRHLVDALNDEKAPVRAEAVRALAQLGGDETILVLRLKAKVGDLEAFVSGHVFDALINLEGNIGVDFVVPYLNSARPDICDEAALALGASRRADAVNVLIETWKRTRSLDFGNVLLRALSSSRTEAAIDFLLSLVKEGSDRDSKNALAALELLDGSEEVRNRIEAAKRGILGTDTEF